MATGSKCDPPGGEKLSQLEMNLLSTDYGTGAIPSTNGCNLRMLVDGPYGNPEIVGLNLGGNSFSTSCSRDPQLARLVLVAGGIGVTPMISMLRTLHSSKETGRSPSLQAVYFNWTVRRPAELAPFLPQLREVMRAPSVRGVRFHVQLHVTRASLHETPEESKSKSRSESGSKSRSESGWTAGRPDYESILGGLASELGSSEALAVWVCGPPPMMESVGGVCDKLQTDHGAERISFYEEIFLL